MSSPDRSKKVAGAIEELGKSIFSTNAFYAKVRGDEVDTDTKENSELKFASEEKISGEDLIAENQNIPSEENLPGELSFATLPYITTPQNDSGDFQIAGKQNISGEHNISGNNFRANKSLPKLSP